MKLIEVKNYEAFEKLYDQYEKSKNEEIGELRGLILLFVASIDPATGQSCCSDCIASKPVIDATIEQYKFNEQLSLAIVDVGDLPQWKSAANPFRSHKVAINGVPTLLSLKSGLRLVEADCCDSAKVSHLFSNSM